MNIYVNNEKLGFQLEGEKSCYDIVIGVQKWAETQNRFLRQILIGEKTFYQADEALKEIPVSDSMDIHFTVVGPENLALEALNDTMVFFTNLRHLDKEGVVVKSDIPEVIQWCSNVIVKSKIILQLDYNREINGTTVNAELGKLDAFIEKLKEKKNLPSDALKQFILKGINLTAWEKILPALIEEAKLKSSVEKTKKIEPSEILRKLQADNIEIPEIITKIEMVATELHTGGDATAMQKLNEISVRLAEMIQHLQTCDSLVLPSLGTISLDGTRTIGDELILMTDIFKQIIDAFDNKDIVLICDLLEYELSPKLGTMSSIIEIVMAKLKESYH
jgi:hypothetical protein